MNAHPRSACGASPSRGRPQRPGEAGSAAALELRGPAPALRVLHAADRALTGVLLAAVAVMVAVVSAQVALRYGFNRSIDWADEVGRLAFVWAIFLAIPLGVRDGAHIGIDL